jgi:predicted MFS family arabinose efflux permease
VGSVSLAVGVLLGGALTTWAGWQLIFWINVPIGAVAFVVALKVLPREAATRVDFAQFDVPGAMLAIGGLTALMFGLGGTAAHGWLSPRTIVALSLAALLLTAFVLIERRVPRPLVPPHTWKVSTLVSGSTVMLGITGILVGAVFLTSIFFQTVMGFSALRAGIALLPLALAITAGTHLASKLLAHTAPRNVAAAGLVLTAVGAALLSTATRSAHFAPDLLPGLLVLGLGVGMVFVSVSITAMAGIPPQHAGMASGFLMTGHEVGAALGVAALSAVAATAGSLTSVQGVVSGYSRGFVAAAVAAGLFAVIAFLKMPAARMAGSAQMHMH